MPSDNHISYIGTRFAWGGEEFFGIQAEDRRRHLYTIGKTGTGKTTLLRNLIVQDIEAGRGVGVIDPHGDLAQSLLDLIPRWRTEDVVYFDPADQEHPIAFNPLDSLPPEQKHLVASGIVSAFKNVWRDSWGARTEYILYAAVAALLDCESATLLGIQRMLSDERYREWVVRQVKDPAVRAFWVREFGEYDTRFMHEAVAPLQNKVGQLVMSPLLRNVLGQVKSRINARFMMDNGRIFIADLSKGRIGEDKSNLLGAMLVTQFQLAANRKVVLQDLREITGSDQVRFLAEQKFKDRFPDCELGVMPPFGNLYGMKVYAAESLAENEEIAFNAGSHEEIVKLSWCEQNRTGACEQNWNTALSPLPTRAVAVVLPCFSGG